MARIYPVEKTNPKTGTVTKAHRVVYKDRRGKERAKQFKKKAKALEFIETLSTQNDPSRLLVKAAASMWLNTVKTVGRDGGAPVSERTSTEYERINQKYINPMLGHFRLTQLRPPDIVQFRTDLLEKTGRSMSKHVLGQLSMICNEMITQGLLTSNPCDTVRIKTSYGRHKKRITIPSPADMATILEGAGDTMEGLIYELLADTGLRISECLGLPIEQVDLSARKIRVVQKLDKNTHKLEAPKSESAHRTLDLSHAAAERLRRYIGMRESGLVFLTSAGDPIDYHWLRRRRWAPLLKQLGVKYFGLHALRHYRASFLILKCNATPLEVAKKLGHSDPGFTLRTYAHLFEEQEELRKAQPRTERAPEDFAFM
jgi:integrase